MAQVSLGNHAKLVARYAEQEQIRAFYKDVLGCRLEHAPGGQVFRPVGEDEDLSLFER